MKTRRNTQIGCSKRRRRTGKTGKTGNKSRRDLFKGGDAYNTIPARYIYPLNEHVLAKPVDSHMSGGSRARSRKYLKKTGGSSSWNPLAYQQQPISDKFTTSNRFLV